MYHIRLVWKESTWVINIGVKFLDQVSLVCRTDFKIGRFRLVLHLQMVFNPILDSF